MVAYDDHETSCPGCSNGLDPEALCDCDTDPMCCRCHRIFHVEMSKALRNWGAA